MRHLGAFPFVISYRAFAGLTRNLGRESRPLFSHRTRSRGQGKVKEKMNGNHNYWVVGATYYNEGSQYERFIEGGFWMLGWGKDDQPYQYELAGKIKRGDRIAIKKMNGRAATDITIMAIGTVREVVLDNARIFCTVNWCDGVKERIVESKGCFASIHGPFTMADHADWLREAFVM